ncbi:MAG: DUF4215 domain-containing protein [Polyangia bacterium]|jgi:cysteine-rich repeat protein|nr:DUF4215 domain-containing protein [Polyangia bacterium]
MRIRHLGLVTLGIFLAPTLCGCIGNTKDPNTSGLCGNGVIDPGEQCDDGNTLDHDGCSSKCVVESFCGNGVVEVDEECDDGNYVEGDGCNAQCQVETGCGNGILEIGEECDDDNLTDGDGCSALCIDEVPGAECGNGIHEEGEGCDWGMAIHQVGCDDQCRREDGCGDGVKDASELCDDGNNVSGDGCSAGCLVEFVCGNDYCETESYESCELCPRDCCPDCGNGILDEGEGCDDGNNVGGDGCSKGCRDEDGVATCGNGIWEAGEECEDGNLTIHDGCSDQCKREFVCGDQLCQREVGENCERCRSDCCPNCGNGVLEPLLGEWCDRNELGGRTCEALGFTGGLLACTDYCTFDTAGCAGTGPSCGNNQAEYGEACDGADLRGLDCTSIGWSGGTLSCTSACVLNTSACTGLLWYFHEDFEDQASATGSWLYTSIWDWGTPSTGPSACLEGARCVGTSMSGAYAANLTYDTCVLESPSISLAGATAPTLSVFMWLYSQASYDGGNVKVSNNGGSTWELLTPDGGYDGTAASEQAFYGDKQALGWHRKTFDLSAWAGQTIKLRFSFASNGYTQYAGWYLDEIFITEEVDVPVQILTGAYLGVGVTDLDFVRPLAADGGTGTFDWSIQPGGTNNDWLSIDPVVGTLSGSPIASNVGPVEVTVRAAVPGYATNFDERTFQFYIVAPAVLPYTESFDQNPVTWTFGTGDWEWGTPSGTEPTACYSGSCIGTLMAGNYSPSLSWDTCWITSPPISLAGATNPVLRFYSWVKTEGSSYDGGNIKVSTDGISFVLHSAVTPAYNLTSVNGQVAWGGSSGTFQGQWVQFEADLSAYVDQAVWIRFAFRTDGSVQYPGWYIDSLTVTD